eukprot:5639984-Prymnesium_polylepis.1
MDAIGGVRVQERGPVDRAVEGAVAVPQLVATAVCGRHYVRVAVVDPRFPRLVLNEEWVARILLRRAHTDAEARGR